MKRLLCAGLAVASLCTASPRPAAAGGGGFVFGTILGLGVGSVIGSAAARPTYPYAPYPYAYYPYGYYPYAAPYAYPPTVVYAQPGYPAPPPPANYAPPGTPRPLAAPGSICRPGQFFNTLTGNCDRR